MTRILIVEDEPEIRENIAELLEAEGFEPVAAESGEKGLLLAAEEPPDLVLCDISLPGIDGYEVLRRLRGRPETVAVPLVFVSARAERSDVRHGMSQGADDYVTKPFTRAELLDAIGARLARARAVLPGPVPVAARAEEPARDVPPGALVLDPAMKALYAMTARVAPGEISVLIQGETGAGKELVAQHVHRASPRARGPFVALNCAALPENLLEAELFGHERGAFTGATSERAGLLESARGGTVFLDELGEMPLTTQAKLLRVLEERKVLRVGGRAPRAIDVRFVAATNRDLLSQVAEGTFREDLYYRLSAAVLLLPPLRERRSEILPLAARFLAEGARSAGRSEPRIRADAQAVLGAYDWPGNVRELRNVIQRALLLADGDVGIEHLPGHLAGAPAQRSPSHSAAAAVPADPGRDLDLGAARDELALARARLERDRIVQALERSAGNQTKAAALLGISRRTLVSRLTEYELPRPRKP